MKAIILIICLNLTVLVGGGWAEELLAPNCFGERCHEMSSLREPKDGDWNCWSVDGYYVFEPNELCDLGIVTSSAPSFQFSVSSNDIYATLSSETESGKWEKLSIGTIDFCKQICFQLKGDDVERCVETEWLYKLLKMMQP